MQPQQIPVQTTAPANRKPMSTSAITGLILSIIAFLMVMVAVAIRGAGIFAILGNFATIVAFICSIVGAISCRATGVRRGMGIAVTGIALSVIVLFLGLYAIQWLQQM
jgi:hypothetical protein